MSGQTGAGRQGKGNLPGELTGFVGRRREVGDVKRLLGAGRLVTLTGVGGVGKTRLAKRVGEEVRRAFPGGVWLVELAAVDDAALLNRTVAVALGLRDDRDHWDVTALAERLDRQQLLLVLDNCEHLLGASAVLVDGLLRHAPQLRVLCTSRQGLGITGEQIVVVPPLAVPAPDKALPVAALANYDAMSLFRERARSVVPDFEITDDNCRTVARLCGRLEGIPLAIELAAVRLRSMSAEQILDGLDDRFRLLIGGSRVALPRQQTLQALIDWSYDLCTPAEQLLWARLSVFAGRFDLESATEVSAGAMLDGRDIPNLLDSLVDKSVVQTEVHGSRAWYRLLDTLREYGQDRLSISGDEPDIRRRHRTYYFALVDRARARWLGADQKAWVERLRLDHANLRAALEQAMSEPDDPDAALQVCWQLYHYWALTGSVAEARNWLDRALALQPEPTVGRARALWTSGTLAVLQGDNDSGVRSLAECQELALKHGDRAIAACAAHTLGLVELYRGNHHGAAALMEQALAGHRESGDDIALMDTLAVLGMVYTLLGRPEDATAVAQECARACADRGESFSQAYALYVLGWNAWVQRDTALAKTLLRESLRLKGELDDRLGIALALEVLTWTVAAEGDLESASRLLGAVDALWQSTGAPLAHVEPMVGDRVQCESSISALGDAAMKLRAAGGEMSITEVIAFAVADEPPITPDTGDEPSLHPLTKREAEIALLVAKGMSNKSVAAELVIAQRTAEGHVERILNKLGFSSRTQIATWVAERAVGGRVEAGRH